MKKLSSVMVVLLAVFACGTPPDDKDEGVVNLLPGDYFDVYADGEALHILALGERGLFYRRSDDGGLTWADAVGLDPAIPETSAPFGHEVRIAARGERVVAIWATNRGFMVFWSAVSEAGNLIRGNHLAPS